MKTIILIAILAFAAAEPDFYNFFQDLNLDRLLENTHDLEGFVDCVLDRGTCMELYEPYKDLFSVAVKEKCHRCTPYQRHSFQRFLDEIKMKLPMHYANFLFKFDPENRYLDDFTWQFNNRGVEI